MTAKPRFLEAPPVREQDPGSLSSHVQGFVGNIIESAAVWYALLYLVQIEGREDYEFEFQRVTENLSTAFLWYIVYAIHKELANMGDRYYIDGEVTREVDPTRVESHLKRQQRIRGVHPAYTSVEDSIRMANITNPLGAFLWLEQRGMLSQPQERCREVATMFDRMARAPPGVEGGSTGKRQMEMNGYTGWLKNFNGDAWRAIAEHGATHEDPTRVTWVDQTFSVEHNNGNFINKVEPKGRRRMDIGGEVYNTDHLSIHEYQNDYLRELLDRNHDGEMSYVFGVAAGVDEVFDLGFGFRRAYSQAGAPDGPIMGGRELQPYYRNPIESNDGP